MWVQSLGQENPLSEEMATHSSIVAWKIPMAEEPGGLQSTSHKESDKTERLSSHACMPAQEYLSDCFQSQQYRLHSVLRLYVTLKVAVI